MTKKQKAKAKKKAKNNQKVFSVYAKSKLKYASSIPNLKDGNKVITSDEDKFIIFNSFLKNVFIKENTTLLAFQPV